MRDFLFEFIDGEYEGEMVFAECNTLEEANHIMYEVNGFDHDELVYTGEHYTMEEAEILGYDTY